MAFNPDDYEPVLDSVQRIPADFRISGNEVSPFNGRSEDQLMSQRSHSQSGQVLNIHNQQIGNNYHFHFHFGQPSPRSNTASTSSGMPNSHSDSFSDTSVSQDDARSGRSYSFADIVTSQNGDSICKVCWQRSANGVIYHCRHRVCYPCGQKIKSTQSPCPFCKMPIQLIYY